MNNKTKKFIVLASSLCLMTSAVGCGKGERVELGTDFEMIVPSELKPEKDKTNIFKLRGSKDSYCHVDFAYLKTVCSPECANEYFSRIVFTDGENVRKEVIKGDNYDIGVVSMDETGDNEGYGYAFYTLSDMDGSFHVGVSYPDKDEEKAKKAAYKLINSFKYTGDPKARIPKATAENEMVTINLGTEWAHAINEKEGNISLMTSYAENLTECLSNLSVNVDEDAQSAKDAAEEWRSNIAEGSRADQYTDLTEPAETEIMGVPAYVVNYTRTVPTFGAYDNSVWFLEKDGKVLRVILQVSEWNDDWENCRDDFMKLINSAQLK